jgi:hypothetical protein
MITGPALLGLFGATTDKVALSPSDTLLLYRTSVERGDAEAARIRRDPVHKRELALLEKAVAKAKTPDDLLKNPEALRVLLQGLGLADQAKNAALARKALLSDPKDSKSLAANLPDARWKAAATQLDFSASGLGKLRDPAFLKVVEGGLVEYRRLTAISERSQAVADALYVSKLTDAKPNIYGVLGDAVLRRVATTVAGLPQELAVQSVEAQARTLSGRFDISQFADPKKREALIQRYLVTSSVTQQAGAAPAGLSLLL